MSNKKEEVKRFLDSLYVPHSKKIEFNQLMATIIAPPSVTLRSVNKNDERKTHYNCLRIITKGDSAYMTFQGYRVCYIDLAQVGKKYAMAFIYDCDGMGEPCRIDIHSPKISIII